MKPVFPHPLPPQGTIGICSPAGPVNPERMKSAGQALERAGYRVVFADSALEKEGLFSSRDDVRRRDLERMFARDDVDAVFCSRGGTGSGRLLSILDTDSIARSRKPFLGFSDVTVIQWLLAVKHRFVTWSGPLAVEWDGIVSRQTQRQAFEMLEGRFPDDLLDGFPRDRIKVLRGSGSVSGPCFPGNLTMITTLLGTPWLPDLTHALLLIEDVSEPPHRVDRMLFHLRNSGVLQKIAGLLCGGFGADGEPENPHLIQSLLDAAKGTDCPIVLNLPYSHGADRMTVPVGAEMVFNLDRPAFRIKHMPQAGTSCHI